MNAALADEQWADANEIQWTVLVLLDHTHNCGNIVWIFMPLSEQSFFAVYDVQLIECLDETASIGPPNCCSVVQVFGV